MGTNLPPLLHQRVGFIEIYDAGTGTGLLICGKINITGDGENVHNKINTMICSSNIIHDVFVF